MRLAEAQLHEAVKAYDMKQLEMAGNLIQEAEQKGCRTVCSAERYHHDLFSLLLYEGADSGGGTCHSDRIPPMC